MHALLCRPYKIRVKGRDWYDFVWYVTKGIPLNLAHLENRMRQSGHYASKMPLNEEAFLDLLKEKTIKLSMNQAKEDIHRFIQDPGETDGWSAEFFLSPFLRFDFQKIKARALMVRDRQITSLQRQSRIETPYPSAEP